MAKREKFPDVEFATEYPSERVYAHHVLLDFTNDDDAANFHDWWQDQGSAAFNHWVKKATKRDDQ